MSDAEIHEVGSIGLDIEARDGVPRDIEWAFVGSKLFIVQSRPITTLVEQLHDEAMPLLQGLGVGSRSA